MADTTVIYRKDYQPPSHKVHDLFLDVQIYDDRADITATMSIQTMGDSKNITLSGEGLTLLSVACDGNLLPSDRYHYEDGKLTISDLPDRCKIAVSSSCNPYENTALEGLYDSQGMLCTQCEPEGFRRICFYVDRPDCLAPFRVRIEADKTRPHLLSNGNLLEAGKAGEGRHYALWDDPFPKPSYLFALVAGDLELVSDSYITGSGRHIDLHIYVEHGNGHLTSHAMDSLKRSMKWDEEVYGLEYDLDLFQIVAVSHFNMGAMENKGLNIFNAKFVLADEATATDDDLARVEAIIAHEYFHNWTGNRVTCRDWFQLTLKEGLTVFRDQCFSADMHDKGVKRAEDVSTLRAIQFPEDNGPTAHPIRPESFVEINNFYTPTVYEKGAEVIRMFHSQLGAAGFRSGMDTYFERHDGQAVTCDDFIASMAEANGRDFSAMQKWYSQAGTPHLHIKRRQDDEALILQLSQSLAPTKAGTPTSPLPIPIRLGFMDVTGAEARFRIDDGDWQTDTTILFEDAKAEVKVCFAEPEKGPFVPSLLRDFSAPVRLFDDLTNEERLHLMACDSDLFNRWDSAQKLLETFVHDRLRKQDNDNFAKNMAKAYQQILFDESLRDDFKALMMTMPGQAVIESALRDCDPVLVFNARDEVRQILATHLLAEIMDLLSDDQDSRCHNMPARHLQNALLQWAVAAGDEQAKDMALKQASHQNMSLSIGALTALNRSDSPQREAAMSLFHDRWQGDSLVMEKWFAMQASAPQTGTIAHIKSLMEHPAFDMASPNKLRSVLGVFCAANVSQFHAQDGSGYAFIADELIALDKRNPQIAARMVLGLTRMSAYDSKRQSLMTASLQKIYNNATSRDLSEVVGKALGR
ncbi:MAG: aminopeptidase N [Candidatus Puniceispirillaceae bacterium]